MVNMPKTKTTPKKSKMLYFGPKGRGLVFRYIFDELIFDQNYIDCFLSISYELKKKLGFIS